WFQCFWSSCGLFADCWRAWTTLPRPPRSCHPPTGSSMARVGALSRLATRSGRCPSTAAGPGPQSYEVQNGLTERLHRTGCTWAASLGLGTLDRDGCGSRRAGSGGGSYLEVDLLRTCGQRLGKSERAGGLLLEPERHRPEVEVASVATTVPAQPWAPV